MPIERRNLVKDTTATVGTGAFVIAGTAFDGHKTVAQSHTNGATVRYHAYLGAEFEVGEGAWNGTTIARDTIIISSNSDLIVNFGAGAKEIITTLTASEISDIEQAHITHLATHAPSDAQKNSDITIGEIEAKLIGEIATHTHAGASGGADREMQFNNAGAFGGTNGLRYTADKYVQVSLDDSTVEGNRKAFEILGNSDSVVLSITEWGAFNVYGAVTAQTGFHMGASWGKTLSGVSGSYLLYRSGPINNQLISWDDTHTSLDIIAAAGQTAVIISYRDSALNLKAGLGSDFNLFAQGFELLNGVFAASITAALTANRAISLQDGSGTLAFLSDISAHTHDADDVTPTLLGTPTINNMQLLHDVTRSAGHLTGFEITQGAGETVDIATGEGLIRAVANDVSTLLPFTFAGVTSVAIPTNTTRHLICSYNAGTPNVTASASDTADYQTSWPVGVVTNVAATLYINDTPHSAGRGAGRLSRRNSEVDGRSRAHQLGGLDTSETGTRNLRVTAGVTWWRGVRALFSELDTNVAGSFEMWYGNASSGWTLQSGQTQIDNTQYHNGSGSLATLTNNRYGVRWFYLSAGNVVAGVFGDEDVNSTAAAEAAPEPATLPPRLAVGSMLLARVIYLKSAGSAYLISSAFGAVFAPSNSGGSGTVTDASVVTANGFAGSVATSTTTPAITVVTTVTGLIKGDGTAISAAVANTDYLTPTGSAAGLTSFPTFNQSTTGSAATWTTGRTITNTGDVTGVSASFNGSGNISYALTIAALAVTDAKVAAANKDGAAGTASMRTLGTGAAQACAGNDSRLSDARTPTSHAHGNITNGGNVGAAANIPLITGTAGIVQAGAFGSTANTFCQGNDSRLSDARTPTAHNHAAGEINSGVLAMARVLASSTALQVVRVNAGNTALETVALAGGGDMLAANNLSDVGSATTSRNNILPSKAGNALKALRVNAGETDYELATVGGGSPGGSTTQIQYNNAGAFAGSADFVWDNANRNLILGGTNTGIVLAGITNEPSAAAAGEIKIYAKSVSGKMLPKFSGPSGLDSPLQTAVWQNNCVLWTPSGATAGLWSGSVGAGAGTYSHQTPVNTTVFQRINRSRWANVVTTLNQVLGQRNTQAQFTRGSVANFGGFFFFARGGFDVWTNGSRFFAGMHTATTVVSAEPSVHNNSCGFGIDAADNGAIFFQTRNATTTTRVATGFTMTSNEGYDCYMFCTPNGSDITWRIVELNTGSEASGVATATLPVNTTMLTAGWLGSNAAVTPVTSTRVSANRIYIETDY